MSLWLSGDRAEASKLKVPTKLKFLNRESQLVGGPTMRRRAFFRQPGAGKRRRPNISSKAKPAASSLLSTSPPGTGGPDGAGVRAKAKTKGSEAPATKRRRRTASVSGRRLAAPRAGRRLERGEEYAENSDDGETDQLSMPVDDRAARVSEPVGRKGAVKLTLATDPSLSASSLDASSIEKPGAAKSGGSSNARHRATRRGMTDDGATAEQSGSIITERPSSAAPFAEPSSGRSNAISAPASSSRAGFGDSGAGRGQSSSSSSSAAVGNVPSLSVVDTGVGGEARNNAAVRPGEEASGGATAAPRITMRDFISKTKHQVISPSKEGSKRVKAGAKWLSRSKRKSGGRKTRSTRSKAEEISGGGNPVSHRKATASKKGNRKGGGSSQESEPANVQNNAGELKSSAALPPKPASSSTSAGVGPQIMLDAEGNIIINPTSTVHIPAARTTEPVDERNVVEETANRVTSASYTKRSKAMRWTKEETYKFYTGLRKYGTSFGMISLLFPNRERRHIKLKFLREEANHPELVKLALRKRLPMSKEDLTLQSAVAEASKSTTGASGQQAQDKSAARSKKNESTKKSKKSKKSNAKSKPSAKTKSNVQSKAKAKAKGSRRVTFSASTSRGASRQRPVRRITRRNQAI